MAPGRRIAIATLAMGTLLALGGCGSGGSTTTGTTQPVAPGANVDPNANGTVTGPINAAKRASDAQEERDRQLEQQTSATP